MCFSLKSLIAQQVDPLPLATGKENEEELIDFVEKILDFGIDLDHSMEAAWDNKNKLKSEAEHLQQRLEKAGERVVSLKIITPKISLSNIVALACKHLMI